MKRTLFFTSHTTRSILSLCLFLYSAIAFSQVKKTAKEKDAKPAAKKSENTPIHIIHANSLQFDKRFGEGAERLLGNVQLEDNGVFMNCDSAYIFPDNSMHAFSNVHLSKPDTMDLYGDSIHYSGQDKKAEVFGKIRFVRQSLTLTTQHMMYVVDSSRVNYWNGGTIVDSATTLVSKKGTYFMKMRMCSFKDSVRLNNPTYNISCDTMSYEPDVKTAHFSKPTFITSKTTRMYCIDGYYNSKTAISEFFQYAYIKSKKGQTLWGQHIYYDKEKDFGEVHDDVTLSDSTDNITIKGNYALYTGSAKTIMVTNHAEMLQIDEKDTLHLHGDTLYGYNISMNDTNKEAHAPKLLLAYHHVKFYRKDMQGKCDSLTYNEKDSVMRMFYNPVLWANENQLTADTMRLYLQNKKINMLDMKQNSFIISKDTLASKNDTLQFNQIKGRNMRGYFRNNKIYKVNVMGNAQTVYYVYTDNNTTILGPNRAVSSNMLVYIDSNKVRSITYLQKPDATIYPIKDIKPAEFLLGDFQWRVTERPMKKEDIFKW